MQGSQMEFKILMLNSLGSFLNNNVNAKKNLIMSGLLDILVSWIGWPDFIDIQSLEFSFPFPLSSFPPNFLY